MILQTAAFSPGVQFYSLQAELQLFIISPSALTHKLFLSKILS